MVLCVVQRPKLQKGTVFEKNGSRIAAMLLVNNVWMAV
jgi:hypothetical protein